MFLGFALALALPFVIELYLDRSLKHPAEVKATLGLPFFLTIPEMNGKDGLRALKGEKKIALLPGKTGEAGDPQTNKHLAVWERSHGLQPFYETLRDRLMTYFEMINLTHKPKLVAVTSCAARRRRHQHRCRPGFIPFRNRRRQCFAGQYECP